jgi:hypothetical protein
MTLQHLLLRLLWFVPPKRDSNLTGNQSHSCSLSSRAGTTLAVCFSRSRLVNFRQRSRKPPRGEPTESKPTLDERLGGALRATIGGLYFRLLAEDVDMALLEVDSSPPSTSPAGKIPDGLMEKHNALRQGGEASFCDAQGARRGAVADQRVSRRCGCGCGATFAATKCQSRSSGPASWQSVHVNFVLVSRTQRPVRKCVQLDLYGSHCLFT